MLVSLRRGEAMNGFYVILVVLILLAILLAAVAPIPQAQFKQFGALWFPCAMRDRKKEE